MKIIINNTSVPSVITIESNEYRVDANSKSLPVSDSIAEKWIKIHGFLQVSEVSEVKVEEVKEEVSVKEEVQEEVKEKKIKKTK